MKAAIFEKPSLENLKVIDNAEQPKISDHDTQNMKEYVVDQFWK
jgi:hypothetical protein